MSPGAALPDLAGQHRRGRGAPPAPPRPGAALSSQDEILGTPRLRASLRGLQVQYQLAADERARYDADRSYQSFEGSYVRRDSLGNSPGKVSSFSSRQSASALILAGDAARRMEQVKAQMLAALGEIERLQGQLR